MKRAWMYLCVCAIMSCAFGNAEGAEAPPTDSMAVRREVKGWAKGRWAVVDTREVKGMLVVVSDAVGREIDLTASYRFGLFQGETVYNQGWRLPVLTQPIAGFQSAVFLRLPNGDYAVRVAFRDEAGLQYRLLRVHREELVRARAYMAEVSDAPDPFAEYPQETDEEVVFETATPRYVPAGRHRGALTLMSGERMRGQLLPVMEDGQMLIETPLGFRRVDVGDVVQIQVGGQGGAGIVQKTMRGGMTYALIGGWLGLLAGLPEGRSIMGEMLFGAKIGGAVGATFGFLDGLLSIQPTRTFHLDAPKRSPDRQIDLSPIRIRVRF